MIEIKLIFYGLSCMLQFSQLVWALSYSVWDVFNNFFLIDATDRSKISSDQKRFFIALSLYPLSFFANTPFKDKKPKRVGSQGYPKPGSWLELYLGLSWRKDRVLLGFKLLKSYLKPWKSTKKNIKMVFWTQLGGK